MGVKKAVFGLILVSATAGCGLIFYNWSKQPAVTKVNTVPAPTKTEQNRQVDIDTTYFTSRLNSLYEVRTLDETPKGATVLQMTIRHTEPRLTDQLSISINQSNESVNELSAVQYRTRNPDLYALKDGVTAKPGAISFKKLSGGHEHSVFWTENGMQVSVVATATIDRGATIDLMLDDFLSHWQWTAP